MNQGISKLSFVTVPSQRQLSFSEIRPDLSLSCTWGQKTESGVKGKSKYLVGQNLVQNRTCFGKLLQRCKRCSFGPACVKMHKATQLLTNHSLAAPSEAPAHSNQQRSIHSRPWDGAMEPWVVRKSNRWKLGGVNSQSISSYFFHLIPKLHLLVAHMLRLSKR